MAITLHPADAIVWVVRLTFVLFGSFNHLQFLPYHKSQRDQNRAPQIIYCFFFFSNGFGFTSREEGSDRVNPIASIFFLVL